jgi:hypothetical protein
MAILSLVRDSGGALMLHSTEPSKNAPFSVFDIDGGGSGDPFDYGSNNWTEVEGIQPQEYDPEDNDTFWNAQQEILKDISAQGVERCIELPDHVEIWKD